MFRRDVDFGVGCIGELQNKQCLILNLTVHVDGKLGYIFVVAFRFRFDINVYVDFWRRPDFPENLGCMRNLQRQIFDILAVDGNRTDLFILSLFFHSFPPKSGKLIKRW